MIAPSISETEDRARFAEVLRSWGVDGRSLSASEKKSLDRKGYAVLAGLLARNDLARLRDEFESAARLTKPDHGVRRLTSLPQNHDVFDGMHFHPRVLAAASHVLRRPFLRVLGLAGRDPMPGHGQQDLHADWPWDRESLSEPFHMVTALWLLDDFTLGNGATRLIPGSHNSLGDFRLGRPEDRHPEEEVIVAKAGSALVYNGHAWHSGTKNRTLLKRRMFHVQYSGCDSVRPGEYPCLEIAARFQ